MDFLKKGEKQMEGMASLDKIENSFENIQDPFDTKNRKPMFNFFGFTDLSVLDYSMGVASGVYRKDVREEWHECLGGPLMMTRDLIKLSMEFMGQDFTNIVGVFSNLVLLQDIANLIVKIFSQLPKDIKACGGVLSEVTDTVTFVIKHINPASLLTNVVTNLLAHLLEIVGDVWNLMIAMFSMNFYEIGRLQGELFILIVD